MIFRRIKAHIAKEDWFAVFIDFIIVVFGVFMGFQVNNWNEAKKDRLAEQEYLVRLVGDTTATVELISQRREDLIGWAENVEALVAALIDGDKDRVVQYETGMIYASRVSRPAPQFSAITELISSGRINIIRDSKIRAAISEAENYAALRDSRVEALDGTQKALVPYIRTRFRPIPGEVSDAGMPKYHYQYDFEALVQDDELINALSQSARHLRINSLWMNDVKQEMEELRSLIVDTHPDLFEKPEPAP